VIGVFPESAVVSVANNISGYLLGEHLSSRD
jgi:hypothetical protein